MKHRRLLSSSAVFLLLLFLCASDVCVRSARAEENHDAANVHDHRNHDSGRSERSLRPSSAEPSNEVEELVAAEARNRKRNPNSESREPVFVNADRAAEGKEKNENSVIEAVFPGGYSVPTVASEEQGTSRDYPTGDNDNGNDRYRVPLESIVVVGDDADNGDEEGDFGDIGYDGADEGDIEAGGNGGAVEEENEKSNDVGIVRIGPVKFHDDYTIEDKPHEVPRELKKPDGPHEREWTDDFDNKRQKDNILPDETELEMRISDDPNDAAVACDDDTVSYITERDGCIVKFRN
ncbi:unnamed protein product [Gongylonema pulchrum]|uniref:Secreted phosphoprotein 24 n=1 Tax=Gongylonema pulchrum TaxID=637853 RepID=A0A183D8B6_9BILA|nr:unnamed protein product [Gongylonema pulchrum]